MSTHFYAIIDKLQAHNQHLSYDVYNTHAARHANDHQLELLPIRQQAEGSSNIVPQTQQDHVRHEPLNGQASDTHAFSQPMIPSGEPLQDPIHYTNGLQYAAVPDQHQAYAATYNQEHAHHKAVDHANNGVPPRATKKQLATHKDNYNGTDEPYQTRPDDVTGRDNHAAKDQATHNKMYNEIPVPFTFNQAPQSQQMGAENNDQAPQGDDEKQSSQRQEWDEEDEMEEVGEEELEEAEEQIEEENGESEANESNDGASNYVEPGNPEDNIGESQISPPKKSSKRKAPLSQMGQPDTVPDALSPRNFRTGQQDDYESMRSRKRQRKNDDDDLGHAALNSDAGSYKRHHDIDADLHGPSSSKGNQAGTQLQSVSIMNRQVLRDKLRKKLAYCGFHNAGNQRFQPINRDQQERDLNELEKVTNELVHAQLRRILEKLSEQQKQRTQMQTLRHDHHKALPGSHMQVRYYQAERRAQPGMPPHMAKPMKDEYTRLICTEPSSWWYLQAEERRSTLLREKNQQQEEQSGANRKDQLVVVPSATNKDPTTDDEPLVSMDRSNPDSDCLLSPTSRKKLTRRRLHQLLQQPGALPATQLEELQQRGFLAVKPKVQQSTAAQKPVKEQADIDKELKKLKDNYDLGLKMLTRLQQEGMLSEPIKRS